MSWIEVKASFPEAPEDWSPLIDLFVSHGCENTLQTDLPASIVACVVEVPGAREEIDLLSMELKAAGAREVLVGPYEEQDWEEAWKKFFKPRRIGKSFLVRPTWEEFEAQPGDHVIVLDPGQAFGTGDHPTTRMCLALLEEADIPGSDILDLGCGSGILSIGAAMLGAKSVLAIDVDPLAVEVAKENAALNRVGITAEVGDGIPSPCPLRRMSVPVEGEGVGEGGSGSSDITPASNSTQETSKTRESQQPSAPLTTYHLPTQTAQSPKKYDIVLSNIISAALIRFAKDVAQSLKPGGRWMVSGILNPNWPDVKKAAEKAGFTLHKKVEEDDWVAAIFLR